MNKRYRQCFSNFVSTSSMCQTIAAVTFVALRSKHVTNQKLTNISIIVIEIEIHCTTR